MKRGRMIIIKLVVFLLLGAVVNVVVAWGCALWSSNAEGSDGTPVSSAESLWPQYLTEAGWPPVHHAARREGHGFGLTIIEVRSEVRGGGEDVSSYDFTREFGVLEINRCGWPMRALQWQVHGTGGPRALALVREAEKRAGLRKGLECPKVIPLRDERWRHRIPVIPVTIGLIANTLFYALVFWLMWSAPFATRRLIRRRCDKCVCCGYDLRHADHEVCPECGTKSQR